jgi:hypothetical protein
MHQQIDLLAGQPNDATINADGIALRVYPRSLFTNHDAIDRDTPGGDEIFCVTPRGYSGVSQETGEALAW